MAQPFNKMPAELRDSTCAALSAAGLTDDHAAWLRKEANARLLVEWIDRQMATEEAAPKDANASGTVDVAACYVYSDEALRTGIVPVVDCPRCGWHHMLTAPESNPKKPFYGMTCTRCSHAFVYRFVTVDREE